MKEYLTIKEFSKQVNSTPQSIYKRLNKVDNPLNNYVKVVDNKKMISVEALKLYQKPELEEEKTTEAGSGNTDIKVLELLQQQLELLQQQLNEKDKQIENLTKLVDQQQQLQLQTAMQLEDVKKEKQLLLEAKEDKKPWWKLRQKG